MTTGDRDQKRTPMPCRCSFPTPRFPPPSGCQPIDGQSLLAHDRTAMFQFSGMLLSPNCLQRLLCAAASICVPTYGSHDLARLAASLSYPSEISPTPPRRSSSTISTPCQSFASLGPRVSCDGLAKHVLSCAPRGARAVVASLILIHLCRRPSRRPAR